MNIEKRYQITFSSDDLEIIKYLKELFGLPKTIQFLDKITQRGYYTLKDLKYFVWMVETINPSTPQIQSLLTDLYRITEHDH